jgi:hypothetical protein
MIWFPFGLTLEVEQCLSNSGGQSSIGPEEKASTQKTAQGQLTKNPEPRIAADSAWLTGGGLFSDTPAVAVAAWSLFQHEFIT